MSSCTAIKVMIDQSEQVDFAEYNIFQFLDRKSTFPTGANSMNQERLEKGKVVWHGALSRATSEDMKTAEKRINQNIEAMF